MIYQNNWRNFLKVNLFTFLLIFNFYSFALAYTLQDAIISAHENNFDIKSRLEQLNSVKMSLPKAYSKFLPQVSFNGQIGKTKFKQYNELNSNPNTKSYALQIQQSLFNGGASLAQVKKSQYTIEDAFQIYKSASNNLTLNVTQAYTGVYYARANYSINENNEKVLKETLELIKTRFDAGQVTITDVLQAESRASVATSNKELAYGAIKNAEAAFEELVGYQIPKNIQDVDLKAIILPKTIDEVIDISLVNNPEYKALLARYNASKYDVHISVAQMLPTITANAQYNRNNNPKGNPRIVNNSNFSPDSDTYSLNVNIPIFQGGFEYADISEKKYLESKANFDRKEIERKIKQAAIQSWTDHKTAKAVIKAQNESIIAFEKAYEAVKEEALIGTRTTLDVLNAEQEVFNARVQLMRAESDYVNAIYSILKTMGSIDVIEIDE